MVSTHISSEISWGPVLIQLIIQPADCLKTGKQLNAHMFYHVFSSRSGISQNSNNLVVNGNQIIHSSRHFLQHETVIHRIGLHHY